MGMGGFEACGCLMYYIDWFSDLRSPNQYLPGQSFGTICNVKNRKECTHTGNRWGAKVLESNEQIKNFYLSGGYSCQVCGVLLTAEYFAHYLYGRFGRNSYLLSRETQTCLPYSNALPCMYIYESPFSKRCATGSGIDECKAFDTPERISGGACGLI